MDTIKILVIGNGTIFYEGLRNVLCKAEDIGLVDVSGMSDKAIELVSSYFPEIVLIDIGLPSLIGLDLAAQIKRIAPTTSVVILTPYYDDMHLLLTIRSGASGYLIKEMKIDDLFLAIRRLHHGENIVTDSVISHPTVVEKMEKLLMQSRDISLNGVVSKKLVSPLSTRELEILSYEARGLRNRQVAHMLGISEQTVKNHMYKILHKLQAKNKTQAILKAISYGWLNTNGLSNSSVASSSVASLVSSTSTP